MIVMHGRANSSNVQKVAWLLDELGLPFERLDRGGRFGGLDDPDYRALNPNGLVPTVLDGDLVLWESHAILRHYARRHPAAGLFPADAAGALRSDMLLDWTTPTLWPPLRVPYFGVERLGKPLESGEVQEALDQVHAPLEILESLLADRDYVGGAAFGIGDIPPAISLSRWLFLGRDLRPWPSVDVWYRRCAARRAFQARVIVGG
jgi:glutathione S-transferase